MKITVLLLCLCGVSLFSTTVISQPRAKLAMPRLQAAPNQIIPIPIRVTTDSLIGLAQFVIEYDSAVVRLTSPIVTIGSALPAFTVTAINEHLPFLPQSGEANKNLLVQISGGGSNAFAGNMIDVMQLNFKAVAANFDSTLIHFDPRANHTFLVTVNLNTIKGGLLEFNDGSVIVGDSEAPAAFDLLSPPDSSWTNQPLPGFRWNHSSDAGSGLAKYQLFVDGVLNLDNIQPISSVATPKDTLKDGDHTWHIRAVDAANNGRASNQTWVVRVDRTPPTSEIIRPQARERLNSAEITIEGRASDRAGVITGIGVRQVLVSTDGGATWVNATNSGVDYSTWRYVWRPAALGKHILQSKAIDKLDQAEVAVNSVEIDVITAVDERPAQPPTTFAVSQNYPNPFHPTAGNALFRLNTAIAFQIPARHPVVLKIFNLRGDWITTLINDFKAPGFYTARWDGTDASGRLVAAGVYFYQMTYGTITKTRKMLIIR